MKKLLVAAICVFLILVFDLGNPDALRQGTEGFYLQISSEMFSLKEWLTPYYLGNPHWSKPPLLFLLAQPFYIFSGQAGLLESRLAVLLFSTILTAIGAYKVGKITKTDPLPFFLFLFSSVGFFKYSRIFMMEMPLVLLSFLSAIFYFAFLNNLKKKNLALSILWATLACQVKGPVSFAMLLPAFFAYGLYHFIVFNKFFLKELFIWFVLSLTLSSFWFIYEYQVFGSDFLNYFFLRENLGKFSSKSYPLTHVFQGLFLYSLPWSLLAPIFFWKLKVGGIEKLSKEKSKITAFFLICFFCFFTLWLIPQQRSHHYALPAIPFFLCLIYSECFGRLDFSTLIRKILKTYMLIFSIVGLLVALVTFSYKNELQYADPLLIGLGVVLLLVIIGTSIRKNAKPLHFFVSQIFLISIFWSLFIPNFILPLVPDQINESTKKYTTIGAVHRKPYFISSSLGREVQVLGIDGVDSFLKKSSSALIIDEPLYLLLSDPSKYRILKEWSVWKRGIKAREIFKNLRSKNLRALKSRMFLIQAI